MRLPNRASCIHLSLVTLACWGCVNSAPPIGAGPWGRDPAPSTHDAGTHDAAFPGEDAAAPPARVDAGSSLDGVDAAVNDAGTLPAPYVGPPRRFVLADEPLKKVLLVDLDRPEGNWDLTVPGGARELQLIGDGELLVGTLEGSGGYHEVDLATGQFVKSELGFGSVMAVRRLTNGHTLLMGSGLAGGRGTVVIEGGADRQVLDKWEFPGLTGGRLIRQTAAGNFLIGARQDASPGKDAMVEVRPDGSEVERFPVNAQPAYMGLRTAKGDTVVSTGHGGSLLVFDAAGTLKTTLGGPRSPEADEIRAHHFSQFQIMPNGHYVVSNWQGHETTHGSDGRQVLEYDADGRLLWSWDQDATRISSIHGIIVLDGLDLTKLHDDAGGVLAPVN